MNTGRRFSKRNKENHYSLENKNDVWDVQNLEKLIDLEVEGCFQNMENQYIDSVNMKNDENIGFLYASCVSVRKMTAFLSEIYENNKE